MVAHVAAAGAVDNNVFVFHSVVWFVGVRWDERAAICETRFQFFPCRSLSALWYSTIVYVTEFMSLKIRKCDSLSSSNDFRKDP
jgi:hypothetical protein